MRRILVLASVCLAAIVGAVSNGNLPTPARADPSTTVTTYRTGANYGHQFHIDINGPVTVGIQAADDLIATGACTVAFYDVKLVHYIVGAVCSGPGSLDGDTSLYDNGYRCVAGVWTADNLVVTADGVVVFDDTARGGPCTVDTTTTTLPPTTTVAPSTTTASGHCEGGWIIKPFRRCRHWVTP